MANTNVTISSKKVFVASEAEYGYGGYTVKYHVDYTDVNTGTGSADTVTMTLGTTPALWLCASAFANVTTAFAGTTAFTMVVGTSTNTNAFIASTSVMSAGLIQPTNGARAVNTATQSTGTSAINLTAVFTNATGGSPSALSAGALDIYLDLLDLAKI